MAIWYEGNLNLDENRHEKDGIVFFVRGVREVSGTRYERYAIQTHFVERGEDLMAILRKYVLPVYEPGDILTLSEKVVSMCQDNTVEKKDVKLSWLAKFLSRFATRNPNGIGMDEPYKLQLAIDMRGAPLVLWASFASAVGKLFGKRGVFYKIVGADVAGIDGFYSRSSFARYHDLAVLSPKDPMGVCAEIEKTLGIPSFIADANDLAVDLLGYSPSLAPLGEAALSDLIGDNPAGQDDEMTPFILVRDIGDKAALPYTPVVAVDGPPAGH